MKTDAVNWFEIYSSDFQRAVTFYETILQTKLQVFPEATVKMAMFPFDMENGIGGAISQAPGCAPGPGGTVIYLNVEGDLDGVLSRVGTAGGLIIKPRMPIGEHGFIGMIQDTEGNIVGLHSMT